MRENKLIGGRCILSFFLNGRKRVDIPVQERLCHDGPEWVDKEVEPLDTLLLDVATVHGDLDQLGQVLGDQL